MQINLELKVIRPPANTGVFTPSSHLQKWRFCQKSRTGSAESYRFLANLILRVPHRKPVCKESQGVSSGGPCPFLVATDVLYQ